MKTSIDSNDVLICGAGPTGLMLATLFAKQGLSFRIVEQDSEHHKESRALAIQPRSMELLHNLGLVEKFLKTGVRAKGVTIFVKGQKAVEVNFADIGRSDTPFPYIFFLSQSVTERILEDHLLTQGIRVERNTKVIDVTQDHNGVAVSLQRVEDPSMEEKVKCRFVIGCDGARSQVRKAAGLEFKGGTYNSEFLLADAKINWSLPADRLLVLLGDKNLGLVMPLKGTALSRIVAIGENDENLANDVANLTTKTAATLPDVERVLQEASSQGVTLSEARWVTRYRVHHRSVEKMRVGRVFLAGDAAHIHSPAGGQGMNTGLQDAANLAWKLAGVLHGHFEDGILETYNSERMPIAKKLLNFTDRIFSAATSHSPIAKKIRNFMIPFVGKYLANQQFFRRHLFGFVSQLNIRYHESDAVIADIRGLARKNICAGSRAPDTVFETTGSIFELIRGYRFHVLVMSRSTISASDRAQFEARWRAENIFGAGEAPTHWIDATLAPAALDLYDVETTLVSLIRPDGYIGYQRDYLVPSS